MAGLRDFRRTATPRSRWVGRNPPAVRSSDKRPSVSDFQTAVEFDDVLGRRYSAVISPVLVEHLLRLQLLRAERVSDRRPIVLRRMHTNPGSRWRSSR